MISDLRYVFRQLFKARTFSAVALLTLALCIGANSAIFSIVRAVLLKPYPWPDSARLVDVHNVYSKIGFGDAGSSIPDYLDRKSGVRGFEDAALYYAESFNLTRSGAAERVVGLHATPSLFTTLRVGPVLGRSFLDAEAQPGGSKAVVLSHALWRNRLGGDPAVVGRTIHLNSETYTVLGVMPESFYFPTPDIQFWIPFVFTSEQRSDHQRGIEFSRMIARLAPGASAGSVQGEMDVLQARNAQRLPELKAFWENMGFHGACVDFLESNVGGVRNMLWLVQAGVAAALLIGCANIACLLLARALGRQRELAIRISLGATRSQVVRLLLLESLVLFIGGGALGLIVALWGIYALDTLGLSQLPRAFGARLDFGVFGFTLLLSGLAGIVFGAFPAWSIMRGNLSPGLNEGSARATSGRRTQLLRVSLVAGEIALAVLLLSTAGLLVKSFRLLQKESPGFTTAAVLTARVELPGSKYETPEKIIAFHDAVVGRLAALPDVFAVGFTEVLPFAGENSAGSYTSPELNLGPNAPEPHAQWRSVDPGYLPALGLTLLRGRWFGQNDTFKTERVAVIDRILADRYWKDQDPIGKHLIRGESWRIVGVVASIKIQNLEEKIAEETVYLPFAQAPTRRLGLVVRCNENPAALAGQARAAVSGADAEQSLYDLQTMTERLASATRPRQVPMLLLSVFSGIALLLAAIGIYGVLAFTVAQREVEFGIRMALGAHSGEVVALVLKQTVTIVLLGVAAGTLCHLALSQILGQFLFGVAPNDPILLVGAPAVLALVALAASVVPVIRATRVDPIVALRSE